MNNMRIGKDRKNERSETNRTKMEETSGITYEMDGRQSRYIKEVLDWHRDEDAGDLRRSELNESVGSATCPNQRPRGETQQKKEN